ncbi:hypothetical protein B9Z65_2170 [Elsinoe australis]|uniref:Uncharacterized protein n=1 Tax=Elsinoe australis TaxID=40998 RepID=A0A2P7YN88_9PEZI|nr:hypothetical protein B9Z65_2170 [Elsinoe australis]
MYMSREPWAFDDRGLLYSYAALLTHSYDFRLAQEKKLVTPDITWAEWQDIIKEFMEFYPYPGIFQYISPRYFYGELRLYRLDMIYRYMMGDILHGYSILTKKVWADYFSETAVGAIVYFYVSIALTAMQVGLATDNLKSNQAFETASYGLTVAAILGPLTGISVIIMVVLFKSIADWSKTTADYIKRMKVMNVTPPGKWARSDKNGFSKV